MAATPEGRELTQRHRVDQRKVSLETVAGVRRAWRVLDYNRLNETQGPWIDATLPVLERAHEKSAAVSAEYFDRFRDVEAPRSRVRVTGGGGGSSPREPRSRSRVKVSAPEFDADQATGALIVTGPARVMNLTRRGEAKPMDQAFVTVAGASTRIALAGGRDYLKDAIDLDRQALGYCRVTKPNPCWFCALLASAGAVTKKGKAVYKSETSFATSNARFKGDGPAKVHDNCQCTLEPIYDIDAPLPGRATEWRQMWDEIALDLGGHEAELAFRRAYERSMKENGDGVTPGPIDLPAPAVPVRPEPTRSAPADMSGLDAAAELLLRRGEAGPATGATTPEQAAIDAQIEKLDLTPIEFKRAELVARNEASLRDLASTEEERSAIVARAQDGLQLFAQDKDVAVNVPSETILGKILADGRLRSQRDPDITETGGGGYLPDEREALENAWFGDHDEPPIYGYLRDRSGKESGADDYGDIALILKPEVSASTTVTVGDSLDDRAYAFPGTVGNPGRYTGNPTEAAAYDTAQDYADYLNGVNVVPDPGFGPSAGGLYADMYVEAQVHGGVTVKDIASVHFKGDPPSAAMVERLRQAGITYTVPKGEPS